MVTPVPLFVGWFVYLLVCNQDNTKQQLSQNLVKGCGMSHGTTHQVSVQIRTQSFFLSLSLIFHPIKTNQADSQD